MQSAQVFLRDVSSWMDRSEFRRGCFFLVTLAVVIGGLAFPTQSSAQQLPYGPDTCKNGFVFREAYPNDHVCVTPKVRQQVATDNAHTQENYQLGGGPYGKETCKNGLVWREARPQDHVCVTPEQRQQAVDDNRYAYSRQQARLLEPHPKPIHSGSSSGSASEWTTFHPGLGGVKDCSSRYMCPPRMKVAVDEGSNTCVCKRQ